MTKRQNYIIMKKIQIYEKETPMKNKYGIQMYSVRDLTEKDLRSALQQVSELGYKYIEFAGFFGHSAEDVAAMLKEFGLEVSGTHSSYNDLRPENLAATIEYHKTLGNRNFIIPGADLSTLDKIKDFCEIVNYAQPILEKEGIRLSYHNHSGEFVVGSWGSTIHSELELRTNMDFELDTYWLYNAGVDPIETMERLSHRLHIIHLKDGLMGGHGKALGEGTAPVAAVREKALEMGLTIVVESETLTPTGIEEVGRCMDFLKSLE